MKNTVTTLRGDGTRETDISGSASGEAGLGGTAEPIRLATENLASGYGKTE